MYGAYNPYQQYQQQYMQPTQQPVHGFVYVTGMDGAKAYQMPPNSEMPLFDSTAENVMYVKTTDGAGFPTIRAVMCSPIEQQVQPAAYATADDIAALRAEIESLRESMTERRTRGKSVSKAAEQPQQ